MFRQLSFILAGLVLTACGDNSAPMPTSNGTLRVLLDGNERALLSAEALHPRLHLNEAIAKGLPDYKTWLVLEARSPSRVLRIEEPAKRYRDQDVILFLDDGGRPALGIFRRDRPELTEEVRRLIKKPSLALYAATSIHIRTVPQAKPNKDAKSLEVVTLSEQPQRLTSDQMNQLKPFELSQTPATDRSKKGNPNSRRKRRGYHLADVLDLVESRAIALARLITADGDDITVSKALLDARTGVVPTIMLNRRGQFIYRTVGGEKNIELRGVTRIELTLEK